MITKETASGNVVMFAGNRVVALKELEEITLRCAMKAFAPDFKWQYASELKMLLALERTTSAVIYKATADFVDLPVSSWRYVTQKGDTRFPTEKFFEIALAEFSLLWESKLKHNTRKLKTLKLELFQSFQQLETAWRQPNYDQASSKKKTNKRREPSPAAVGGIPSRKRVYRDRPPTRKHQSDACRSG